MLMYFIRHGESTFNAEGRIQGQLESDLSEQGRRQSEALARVLATRPIQAIFSSPQRRARETAEATAALLGLPVQLLPELREIHAGILQGLCWSEIDVRYPEAARAWRSGEPDFVIEGGESRRQLMQRGQRALEIVRESGHDQVAVFSHGGLLAAALKGLLGIPAERNPFSFYNAAINTLRWDRQVKVLQLNQTDHLRLANCLPTSAGDL